MIRISGRLAAAVLAALWLAAPAAAQRSANGCKAEIEKFCSGVTPGEGRIFACLKEHEGRLSKHCKWLLARSDQKLVEAREACRDDVQKACKDVQPGEGRLVKCLADHQAELSSGCQSVLKTAEKNHPCFEDMEAFCKDVQPGNGRIGACLKANRDKLSPACKARIPPAPAAKKPKL